METPVSKTQQTIDMMRATGKFFEVYGQKLEKMAEKVPRLKPLAAINFKCKAVCHHQCGKLLKERMVKSHQKLTKVDVCNLSKESSPGDDKGGLTTLAAFQVEFKTFMQDAEETIKVLRLSLFIELKPNRGGSVLSHIYTALLCSPQQIHSRFCFVVFAHFFFL